MERPNVLFVCSRNQWRSPTAEAIYRKDPRISVRSAGLASSARRRVSARDLDWADLVMVMTDNHKSRLRKLTGKSTRGSGRHAPVHVLDIPDDYGFMDPELVAILHAKVGDYLAAWLPGP